MSWYDKYKDKYRTLYHIGNGYPIPVQFSKGDIGQKNNYGIPDKDYGWIRDWKKVPKNEKVVFLTREYCQVYWNHGKVGNVYIFDVPEWVIKESGGLHRFDEASEIIIPESLWKNVIFKGKIDKNKMVEKCKNHYIKYYDYNQENKDENIEIGSYVNWMDASKNGLHNNSSVFIVQSIKRDMVKIKYIGEIYFYTPDPNRLYYNEVAIDPNEDNMFYFTQLLKLTKKKKENFPLRKKNYFNFPLPT